MKSSSYFETLRDITYDEIETDRQSFEKINGVRWIRAHFICY